MRVLAIDTSSNVATVAVMEDELLLGEYILNHKKTHSQKIMTMIEQILSELELTVQNIDIFAAAIGPGSFTGLRIGVATVKALAHATGKPVVSVGTLEALAYNVPYAEHIIVPTMALRKSESLRQSALMNVLKVAVNFLILYLSVTVLRCIGNILKKNLVTRRYFRLQMH